MRADFHPWTTPLVASFLLAVAVCGSTARAAPPPERQAVAITDVTVVDVEHERLIDHRTVVIDEGRIVSITKPRDAHIPISAQRIDGRGRFLMPGLVDMHVHMFNLSSHRPPNEWSFPLYVANGVTAVREMRADAPSMVLVKHWRKAFDDGELLAPRILAAGIAVLGASPEYASREVDAAADAGADFIKVFSEVPASHWRAIMSEARARSLPVVGHVPAGVPLLVAAAAGQRSDEHLMQAFEACSSIEAAVLEQRRDLAGDALLERSGAQEVEVLDAFDAPVCQGVAKALAATGQVQVPTLALADEDLLAKSGRPSADPRWRYLPAGEQARWQRFLDGYTAQDATLERLREHVAQQIVTIMHQAGVTIMAGTDSPMPGVYPGFALHDELERLADSGFTPAEVLRSATLEPARFLGIANESGTVAVGKRADLLLLDADPTKDVRNTRRIRALLLNGRLLQRADLDALLKNAASAQAH